MRYMKFSELVRFEVAFNDIHCSYFVNPIAGCCQLQFVSFEILGYFSTKRQPHSPNVNHSASLEPRKKVIPKSRPSM